MIVLLGNLLTGKKEADKKEIEMFLGQTGPIHDLAVLDCKIFR